MEHTEINAIIEKLNISYALITLWKQNAHKIPLPRHRTEPSTKGKEGGDVWTSPSIVLVHHQPFGGRSAPAAGTPPTRTSGAARGAAAAPPPPRSGRTAPPRRPAAGGAAASRGPGSTPGIRPRPSPAGHWGTYATFGAWRGNWQSWHIAHSNTVGNS